jgi:hypothetical protein
LGQVNGIYNLFGFIYNDGPTEKVGVYTNWVCTIEKRGEYWCFYVSYCDIDAYSLEVISLYEAESDTDYPPSTGWIGSKKYLPAPTIISKKAE